MNNQAPLFRVPERTHILCSAKANTWNNRLIVNGQSTSDLICSSEGSSFMFTFRECAAVPVRPIWWRKKKNFILLWYFFTLRYMILHLV